MGALEKSALVVAEGHGQGYSTKSEDKQQLFGLEAISYSDTCGNWIQRIAPQDQMEIKTLTNKAMPNDS